MTELRTRRPSGKPSWPIVLLAGAEKAGKSWACAQASASDLIGRTLWLGLGEDDPDEYANVPGADFEIVEHDGTYRGFLAALEAAVAAPRIDARPNLIVWDSATRGWNLLCDMAQDAANARAKAKGKGNTSEADITMDLWNTAKQRWVHIMDTFRDHDGPVLITARLDEVTVMSGGKPTTDKMLKVQAEKSLPYDVGAVVEMPERGKTFLKGVRSARLQLAERTQVPDFTVDRLWRELGLDVDETAPRTHPQPQRGAAPTPIEDDPFDRPSGALADALAGVSVATSRDEMRTVWNQHKANLDDREKAALSKAMQDRDAELQAHQDSDTGASGSGEELSASSSTASQPPAAPVSDPESDSPATRSDLTRVSIRLGELGITDRKECVEYCGAVIGRHIASRSEMTRAEAAVAIARLDQDLLEVRRAAS